MAPAFSGAFAALEADPSFAGLWWDQDRAGRLTIAFVGSVRTTSSRRALTQIRGPLDPIVREAVHTTADLMAQFDRVGPDQSSGSGPARYLQASGVDVVANAVVLTVAPDAPADTEQRLRETYDGPGVVVERAVEAQTHEPLLGRTTP